MIPTLQLREISLARLESYVQTILQLSTYLILYLMPISTTFLRVTIQNTYRVRTQQMIPHSFITTTQEVG